MKSIFTLSLLSLAISASAQITLNQSSYSSWRARTAIAYPVDTSITRPTITPSTNASWNFSSVTYDTTNVQAYEKGVFSSSVFPNATFYDYMDYQISGPLRYRVRQAGALTAGGFVFYGQSMTRQALSIGAISGGATDSLVFPQQNISFSSNLTTIKFPATIGSTWSSNYDFATNFNLTIAAFSFNNTPCQRKTRIMRNDAVVGWGSMIVKDSLGAASTPANVLMVKTATTSTDSFFVNGLPAPVQLLTAFGLSQGQMTNRYEYQFYRAGELMPLVQAGYSDSTFASSQMEYMDVHVGSEAAQSVREINSVSGLMVYPNPVRNQTLYLQIADRSILQLGYQLININGQVVDKGTVNLQNGGAQLQAEAFRTPGIYYLQISGAHVPMRIMPISVE